VDVLKEGYANPEILQAELKELVPDAPPVLLDQVLKGWIERRVWNPIGGVQPDTMQAAIEFYASARPYERIKAPEDVSTTEYVEGLSE
jgi:hypothetical protein